MAYQITGYADRAATRPLQHSDEVSDYAIHGGYTAPTGAEIAYARHSNNPELSYWGYDGEWHRTPPAELIARDAADMADAAERNRVRFTRWIGADTVELLYRGQVHRVAAAELQAAATQDDALARAIYRDAWWAAEAQRSGS